MINGFRGYEEQYPSLVYDILNYFMISITDSTPIKNRSILNFCQPNKEVNGSNNVLYQPDTIDRICRILCDKNIMTCIRSDSALGLNNNYLYCPSNIDLFRREKERLEFYFNSIVYGFPYIYNMYKSIVVPLVWEDEQGKIYMGTGFKFLDGIVTAKHCIADAKNLMIKGYMADELRGKNIYISENEDTDIAFIETKRSADIQIYSEDGEVLQEVLVMGYPRIPSFTDFLTAERATISSKAEARITPSKGTIAAYGNQYLNKIEAMLITAKICGGNSGGPVINEYGCVVGVACQVPDYTYNQDNYYDDLGYGIVVPFKYAKDIIESRNRRMPISEDYFRDYR